jgi:hypothetical protein
MTIARRTREGLRLKKQPAAGDLVQSVSSGRSEPLFTAAGLIERPQIKHRQHSTR